MRQWAEIAGEIWRTPTPAGKMHCRKDHLAPLSRQAFAILQTMKARSRGSHYVFPAEHRLDRPISENAILYLLHRMGYQGQMTRHGWRSVGSTWVNEKGSHPDAIERQLAHVPGNKTRAVYNRAQYWPERKKLLQAWADEAITQDEYESFAMSTPSTP
jgi:integrase